MGIFFANLDSFLERGFKLPPPIPEDDESVKGGDELKALLLNLMEERGKLRPDETSSHTIAGELNFGVSILQPSEYWDSYEKDWKDPKKRKQNKGAKATTPVKKK